MNQIKSKRNVYIKKIIAVFIFFIVIPIILIIGVVLFDNRSYNVIAIIVAILSLLPFFVRLESSKITVRELVVIATLTAIAVLGRLIFAPIHGFKPISALIIIAAISYGECCGFIVGSLSALISNIYFIQGPWTPFQMLAFGMLGFFCGLFGKYGFIKKWWALVILGIIGGVVYSAMVDIWTVIAYDATFSIELYWAKLILSLPWMCLYALSNVVFLLILTKPITKKLDRLKDKYGIFER